MSYNIGQLRRNQYSNYSTEIQLPNTCYQKDGYETAIFGSITANDTYIGLPNNQRFQKDSNYYFRFKVNGSYHFKVKLAGESKTMTIKEFKTSYGNICELVFTPNDNIYNMIVFERVRGSDDINSSGIILDSSYDYSTKYLTNIKLELLTNIITSYLSSKYTGLVYLKKLGLQGPPGFMFSMNGEEFYIGKSGIFEVNDINITNLSFVIKNISPIPFEEDGKQKDFFIMDFQY